MDEYQDAYTRFMQMPDEQLRAVRVSCPPDGRCTPTACAYHDACDVRQRAILLREWDARQRRRATEAAATRMFRLIADGYGIDRMARVSRLAEPARKKARQTRERAARKAYRELIKKGHVCGLR